MIKNFFNKKKRKSIYSRDLFNDKYIFGKHTYGNPKILDWGEGASLRIGKFCSIAKNVEIFLGGNHRMDWVSTYPFMLVGDEWSNAKAIQGHPRTNGDVLIGNDVWICRGVKILSGVKIGDGAVIGAYSVVSKDVPPYAIVAGNPSRIIRYRFSDDLIEKLLEIEWWNLPDHEIENKVKKICSDDIEAFIDLF